MCIRDSCVGIDLDAPIVEEEAEALPVVQAVADSLSGCRTCLLYTSDAADERSSVDLGGRRIIKKKQHHSEYSHCDDE